MGYSTIRTGVTADGDTGSYIYWGTENAMADSSSGNQGYYTVLDISEEQVEAFRSNLEQGSGLTAVRVIGIDGVRWNVRVREDSRFTPPNIGTQVYVVDKLGMVSGAHGSTSPASASTMRYRGRVVGASGSVNPKGALERTIAVERLTLIDT